MSDEGLTMYEQELRAKYKYQFEHPNCLDIAVAKGWIPIFSKLCADIDAAGGRELKFFWRQVKEKLGGPRLSWSAGRARRGNQALWIPQPQPKGPSAEVITRITNLVKVAQGELAQVCIVCGSAPAAIDQTGGYMLNLCAKHSHDRKLGLIKSPWS